MLMGAPLDERLRVANARQTEVFRKGAASLAQPPEILQTLEARPTAGWALRRGQLVHGADDPVECLLALRDYSLRGRTEMITCPTFVCNAEGDDISSSAPSLFDALPGEKEYVLFTAAGGAGDHCEAGARTLYHALSFGWLGRAEAPRPGLSGWGNVTCCGTGGWPWLWCGHAMA